ncbi:hypothetical protein [Cerasicoccus frondis]|uniref:hypothetical protein n=1 Tax=Cerasicoccus frondis TaxID=490090 RepID=UPI00285274B3|nr:hypothetical protein [Cerasicoccus frondis]
MKAISTILRKELFIGVVAFFTLNTHADTTIGNDTEATIIKGTSITFEGPAVADLGVEHQKEAFSLSGSSSTYYPVYFEMSGNGGSPNNRPIQELIISQTGAASNSPEFRLIAQFRFQPHGWGHGPRFAEMFIKTKSTNTATDYLVADFQETTYAAGIVVWLQGGRSYSFSSPTYITEYIENSDGALGGTTGEIIIDNGETYSPRTDVADGIINNGRVYRTPISFQDSSGNPSVIIDPETGIITASEVIIDGPDNKFVFQDSSATGNASIEVGSGNPIIQITGTNLAFGHNAGNASVVTGTGNVSLGSNAGSNFGTNSSDVAIGLNSQSVRTSGGGNVAIGVDSMKDADIGSDSVAIGDRTLRFYEGDFSVAIGHVALSNYVGPSDFLVALGKDAMAMSGTGTNPDPAGSPLTPGALNASAALGYRALWHINDGLQNTAVGSNAGVNFTSGNYNAFMGNHSGATLYTGGHNTFIGPFSASNLTTGSRNIAIGENTIMPDSEGSDQLNIGNTIYGDLANGQIGIGVTDPVSALQVAGNVNVGYSGENIDRSILIHGSAGGKTGVIEMKAAEFTIRGSVSYQKLRLGGDNSVFNNIYFDITGDNPTNLGEYKFRANGTDLLVLDGDTGNMDVSGKLTASDLEVAGAITLAQPAGDISMGVFGAQ